MITRLRVRNFKSIRSVDVSLPGLAVFVGENGSGKSNLLDALRFVKEALDDNLDHAIRERGGIAEVRRRSSGHPTHLSIDVDVSTQEVNATYGFQIAAVAGGGYVVSREFCHIHEVSGSGPSGFEIENGVAVGESGLHAQVDARDLYLRAVSGVPPFASVYRALRSIGILNPNAGLLREYQKPDASEYLSRDGRNLASIVKRMAERDPGSLDRVIAYLAKLVPGVRSVKHRQAGPRETLVFDQEWDNGAAWEFFATSMSDGTLRAVALLIAIQQEGVLTIGIEEPEVALHSGAARVLADALVEASAGTQIVITTHSPDLLDHEALARNGVFLVRMNRGVTTVEPMPAYLVHVVQEGLFTVGELLRLGQLVADPIVEVATEQSLFGEAPVAGGQ
ncbi:MAG: AAA family ATPase [Trueperaceae bacterium]|nr:AAA family ATPase [Trueperaceae bacterium]